MPTIKHIPQYSYRDYENWEGDWELIDGYPFARNPSSTGTHQSVSGQLLFMLMNCFVKPPYCNECYVYSALDWIIDSVNVVRPDLAVVCGKRVEKFIENPPMLIVEIISESSSYRDRIVKKQLYENNNVKYYLMADPKSQTIETFELIDGRYNAITSNEFVLNEKCKLDLDFAGIW
jgi:Uma2 family endonuclease